MSQFTPLKKWLISAVGNDATSIELRHDKMTLLSEPVESSDDSEVSALLDKLLETAQEEANNSAKVGPSRFKLKANYDSRTPTFSPTFSLRTENEDDEFESEGNTKDDLVGQLMRHNEVMMRLSTIQSQKTIETLTRQNETLVKTFNENLEKRVELAEKQEQLLSQQSERELAVESARREEERKDKIMGKVIPLLPVAVNRFLGDRKLPEPVNPKLEILKNISKKIPTEKLMAIANILGPEVSAQLFELLGDMAEEAEKEDSNG